MKFIIEQSAYSGVLKIAGKVAHDMELVTGTLPEIRVVETIDHEEVALKIYMRRAFVFLSRTNWLIRAVLQV